MVSKAYVYIGTCSGTSLENQMGCIASGMNKDFPGTSWNAFIVDNTAELAYSVAMVDDCRINAVQTHYNIIVWRSS